MLVLLKYSLFPLDHAETARPHDKNDMVVHGKVHME